MPGTGPGRLSPSAAPKLANRVTRVRPARCPGSPAPALAASTAPDSTGHLLMARTGSKAGPQLSGTTGPRCRQPSGKVARRTSCVAFSRSRPEGLNKEPRLGSLGPLRRAGPRLARGLREPLWRPPPSSRSSLREAARDAEADCDGTFKNQRNEVSSQERKRLYCGAFHRKDTGFSGITFDAGQRFLKPHGPAPLLNLLREQCF